jgi:IS4 transposase
LAWFLVEFFWDLIARRFDEVADPQTVSEEFSRFRDIMAADGTILRLHEFLMDEFRARKE